MRNYLWIILMGVAALVGSAYGYLDPGTGSYLLQLIVGTALGGLFAIGIFWRRVFGFVKGLFSRRKPDDNRPE